MKACLRRLGVRAVLASASALAPMAVTAQSPPVQHLSTRPLGGPSNKSTTPDVDQMVAALNLKSYATGNGATDDTAMVQGALNAAVAQGRPLLVPCGTYKISAKLKVATGASIHGLGACSKFVAATSFSADSDWTTVTRELAGKYTILANANYSEGNANITIEDIAFDMSALQNTHPCFATQSIGFVNVTNVQVRNIKTNLGGDGIFFIRSSHFMVENSVFNGHANAAVDSWDGNASFAILNNTIDGSGAIIARTAARSCLDAPVRVNGAYGVVVTGIDSVGVARTSKDVDVRNNHISNVSDLGIWIQGGCSNATGSWQCGHADSVRVMENDINNVTSYHGIRLSESQHALIEGNVIEHAVGLCIDTASEHDAMGFNADPKIVNNTCNTTVTGGGNPAIKLTAVTTAPIVFGNHVFGGSYTYALTNLAAGARIFGNVFAPGSSSDVSAGGSGMAYDGWLSYDPGPVCASGSVTLGAVSGRWMRIANKVTVQIDVFVTAKRNCNGLTWVLPQKAGKASTTWIVTGRETALGGALLQSPVVHGATSAVIYKYDNSATPFADSTEYLLTGSYEAD